MKKTTFRAAINGTDPVAIPDIVCEVSLDDRQKYYITIQNKTWQTEYVAISEHQNLPSSRERFDPSNV